MDNRYYKYNCPALMSDGRFTTSYVDNHVINQYIRTTNKLHNSYDYKKFLQHNASAIIKRDRENFINHNMPKFPKKKLCTYCCTP